jgi:hypothetical protein
LDFIGLTYKVQPKIPLKVPEGWVIRHTNPCTRANWVIFLCSLGEDNYKVLDIENLNMKGKQKVSSILGLSQKGLERLKAFTEGV